MNKNEIKSVSVHYDHLNASLSEDAIKNPALYFPSCEEVIMTTDKVNPFVDIITENIELHNAFRLEREDARDVIHDVINSCAQYMSNSIMMNAVSILEDPYNPSFIPKLKQYVETIPTYGQNFYNEYTTYINSTSRLIFENIVDKMYEFYFDCDKVSLDIDESVFIPFMTSIIEYVSKVYIFEGQRFITKLITNGSIDMDALNSHLMDIYESSGITHTPEQRAIMNKDYAIYLTFFNMALNEFGKKISEITEAIVFSGIYNLKKIINEIDWAKLYRD